MRLLAKFKCDHVEKALRVVDVMRPLATELSVNLERAAACISEEMDTGKEFKSRLLLVKFNHSHLLTVCRLFAGRAYGEHETRNLLIETTMRAAG